MTYNKHEFDPRYSPYRFIGGIEGILLAEVSDTAKINRIKGTVFEFNEAQEAYKQRLEEKKKRREADLK